MFIIKLTVEKLVTILHFNHDDYITIKAAARTVREITFDVQIMLQFTDQHEGFYFSLSKQGNITFLILKTRYIVDKYVLRAGIRYVILRMFSYVSLCQ